MSESVPGPIPGAFAVAPYLREIGRGKDGSRALAQERARELMGAMLAGAVGELELGAVLIALRMKGESASEIAGFLEALEPHVERAPSRAPAWVVIPSYNGARSTANLVPLLALLLARSGLPVLVHGQASEPASGPRARVTSAAIFAELGISACTTVNEAPERAAAGLPAVLELRSFAPALARLIALRPRMGVRNVAHTLAKLLRPVQGPSLLVSSYTHPAFGLMQAELFRATGEHALTMRATDGEAVINARRSQAIDCWRAGNCVPLVPTRPIAGPVTELPGSSLAATVQWTREVLSGERAPPEAISLQAELIAQQLHAPEQA